MGNPSLLSQAFPRALLEQDGPELSSGPSASSCLGFPRRRVQLVHPSILAVLSSSQAELYPAVLRAFQWATLLLSHGTYRETPSSGPHPLTKASRMWARGQGGASHWVRTAVFCPQIPLSSAPPEDDPVRMGSWSPYSHWNELHHLFNAHHNHVRPRPPSFTDGVTEAASREIIFSEL